MTHQDSVKISHSVNDSSTYYATTALKNTSKVGCDSASARVSNQMLFDAPKVSTICYGGKYGTPIPSLPRTENWVFGILFLIFTVLVFSKSVEVIFQASKYFFQVKERISIFTKTTISDLQTRILMIIFPILVFSFYGNLLFSPVGSDFSFLRYLLTFLCTGLFVSIKSLLVDIVGYVFSDKKNVKMYKESYLNVFSFVAVLLFPMLVIRIYSQVNLYFITDTVSLVTCILGGVLIFVKLFQIFSTKTVSTFYILLYLCTLELLPYIGLIRILKLISNFE
jgi:Domain of unknown function (DUF4271)